MSNVSKGQIQLPGEFRPGEPIRAGEMDKLRKAIAFVMKDMIGSGRGITVTQSAGKYLISARKQRRGASSAPGMLIYRAGETEPFFFDKDDFFTDTDGDKYDPTTDDDWSIEFVVTGGALADFSESPPVGTTKTDRYDGNANSDPVEPQTVYRIPVIRTVQIGTTEGGDPITKKYKFPVANIYRENIFCDLEKGPIVELMPIA